jgi:ubiquinone/menaquinone biosynthesis C-methylase UbiE
LDVAAGAGAWGVPLALNIPDLHVTAVDWEPVLEVTRRTASRWGVGQRFTFLPGDLDTIDFGKDYDIAVLGHVLHAIGAPRSRKLLKKTFDSLAPGGTVVVPEYILDEDRAGPLTSVCFTLAMLVLSDEGAAYTLKELTSWLHEAGFVDVRLFRAVAPSPLILATKPG